MKTLMNHAFFRRAAGVRRVVAYLLVHSLWVSLFPLVGLHAAANANDEYSMQMWVTEDGMPQNIVTAVLQARSGYLWAATYNGIALFDGIRFRIFDSANTAGLTNSRVTCLYEDPKGTIWVGHDTSDLSMYSDGKFHFVQPHGEWTQWSGGTIRGIACDKAGEVWIANIRGEVVRIRDGLLIHPPPEIAEDPSLVPQLIRDDQGRLLLVRNGYMAEVNEKGCTMLDFHSLVARPYYERSTVSHGGGIWVVGQGRVRKWQNNAWVTDLGASPWQNEYLTSIIEDVSGRLLVGTLNKGLYIYEPTEGWMNLNRKNGLPSDWVRCLTIDREQNVWVGSSGGLVLLRPRKVIMYNAPDGWLGRPVQAIARARSGAVWAATEGAGLYRLENGEWQNFGIESGLSNTYVWSVIEDHTGKIWAGTWGGGLFGLEGSNFVRQFDFVEKGEPVLALKEDVSSNLWVGTGNGLVRIHGTNLTRFNTLGGTAAADIRALETEPDGTVWFGSQGGGLGRLKDGKLTNFTVTNGLPTAFILCLHTDASSRLWIGTLDKGVCLYEGGKFRCVTTEQGLPNNNIGHIEEDGLGNLWFNSQLGLFRVPMEEMIAAAEGRITLVTSLVFGKGEGLSTLAGSSGFTPSGFRAPDGKIWFPTVRGIATVNPKAVRRNNITPPVWIEEVIVDGLPGRISPVGSDWGFNGVATRGVRLQPGRKQLDFTFTGLSFSSPERVSFKYQLSGLDTGWTEAGTRRRVTYSFLPPGNYDFHVIASNGDGVWNESGDVVAVVVEPELWQTWWFKIAAATGCFALTIGAAYLESRRRHRRKLERIDRERALERERARIAQDIHDDLGASLTRIGMLSESATEDLGDPVRAAESLGKIYTTARDLTRAMDEIVWAVNPRHDTLESLSNYITRFAYDFLNAAHVRCRLDAPISVPELVVRSEVRHNLFLSFKEVLNNVVKHSKATEVRVTLAFEEAGLRIIIADNGEGFEDGQVNAVASDGRLVSGHGISSIRNRLSQIGGEAVIESAAGQGTKVELFVPVPHIVPIAPA